MMSMEIYIQMSRDLTSLHFPCIECTRLERQPGVMDLQSRVYVCWIEIFDRLLTYFQEL